MNHDPISLEEWLAASVKITEAAKLAFYSPADLQAAVDERNRLRRNWLVRLGRWLRLIPR